MDLENVFIGPVASATKRIGDDGALVGDLVFSKDAFVEGTHFRRAWMTLPQIAYKAMAVNISDAVAMNAEPRFVLLAVGIPKCYTAKEVRELSEGFVAAAEAFGCEIVGGDTVASERLSISVTVVSETKRPLLRRGIKTGDLLAFTGTVGKAAKELRYLLAGGKLHRQSHFVRPQLRGAFIAEAAPFLRAGMDISDGIFTDLQRMAKLNRVGFRIPKSLKRLQGCSGEEYEMLIAFSPRKRKKIERLARKHRLKRTVFAEAVRRRYINPCKSHHF